MVDVRKYSWLNSRLKSFRREFSHLGEIHSLLPTNVHIMSLTVTASNSLANWKHPSKILSCSSLCPTYAADSPFFWKEVTWSCIKDNSGETTRTIDGSPLRKMSNVHGRQP